MSKALNRTKGASKNAELEAIYKNILSNSGIIPVKNRVYYNSESIPIMTIYFNSDDERTCFINDIRSLYEYENPNFPDERFGIGITLKSQDLKNKNS